MFYLYTVEEGITKLIELKYEETIIIISGSLFSVFYKEFDEKLNELQTFPFPIIIIYCFNKENFIANLISNNIYDNNYLLNKELIFNKPKELIAYINGEYKINLEDVIFDEVTNLKELIIPCNYSYLIGEVTKAEIDLYNQIIISNYKNKNSKKAKIITTIIRNLQRYNLNLKNIIAKYWLIIYTMETDFYPKLNQVLRKQEENQYLYHPLIKICYEGIRNEFLSSVTDKILYRGGIISKIEFEKLKKKINEKKMREENNEQFPKVIVYSRCFLSFSENKDVADYFLIDRRINQKEDKFESVLYEIEKMDNKENIDLNTLSNCSLKSFSNTKCEAEVLFLPFSCFEVNDLKLEQNNNHAYYKIYLKYLGRYGNAIREQLGDNFFKEIERTKFSEDLIDAKITLNKNFLSTWKIKKIFNNKYEKLCFMIDNKQEFLTISNNSLLINNLNQNQKISIHIHEQIKIISLIKLDNDRICFSTSNNFIQIIQLYENNNYTNYNYKIMFQVRLNFNAYNLLYLNRERNIEKKISTKNEVDQILFTNNNSIYCIYNLNRNRFFEELTREDNNIFIIKVLPDNHIIYN